MEKRVDKVVIVGMGYIGLPTAALLAKNNIEVTGVDINKDVVETINKGQVHFYEPDLDEYVKNAVETGKLKASLKPESSDVFLIVVPTPFKEVHEPDISFVESAIKTISPYLKEQDLLIIESTSPVGTTEKMAENVYEQRPELKNKISMAYCPERVMPGNVMYELENNDPIIGGI